MRRLILGMMVMSLLLAACAPSGGNSTGGNLADRTINLVTTVGMIGDIAKNVGGERVNVVALMGPGVDPHLYKPTASDVQTLENADVIFYGGLELEGRMTDVFVKLARSGKPTFAVSEDIDASKLRQPIEFEGKYDPHIWFDVTLWQDAVRKISKEMQALDPSHASTYQQNADAYLKELDTLHQYVKTQITSLPETSRVLITAHDAFGYFGQQYGVEVRGLQGTSTATEAGAKDVQDLAEFIIQRQVKAIFVESSVPQATIEAVQKAVEAKGWEVKIGGQLFSDAMGAASTPEGTYIGMVRHNVDTIVNSLR
ncbi:MAG: zinc ABC transporter substrate-binding protein [Anaerolineales bacterium]|nr:zinc ABC transporter substrate-binding protein [Anaerolineales bacterium]